MNGLENGRNELLIRTERVSGAEVQASFRDTGVGVQPSKVDQIFGAFYTTKGDVSALTIRQATTHLVLERVRLLRTTLNRSRQAQVKSGSAPRGTHRPQAATVRLND
jgi:hypothetical protein